MSKGTRREITDEERDAVVVDYKAGIPTGEIAEKHKRHMSVILEIVKKSGVAMRGKGWRPDDAKPKVKKVRRVNANGIPDEERERMAADYAAGMTQAKMVEKYGRSPDAIRHSAELHGVPLRGRGWRGKDEPAMKARKGTMRAKMKKRMNTKKHAVVAASISHANKALHKAHKQNGAVSRAVAALLKALAHEDIQDIFVDFGKREFKLTRFRTEEGRV